MAEFMESKQDNSLFCKGDDDLDNKTDPSTAASTLESNSKSNTNIETLKFEVGQEMGIKPKAKNKKN